MGFVPQYFLPGSGALSSRSKWVDLNHLKGEIVDARWFNPVNGEYQFIQRFHDKDVTKFYRSENTIEQDHLLVLSAI
jgi:hypothetical protein